MTAKKSRAKKTVADVAEEQDGVALTSIEHPGADGDADLGDINPEVLETIEVEIPDTGPDYQVTEAGDIILTSTGAPIPEDHPVHPVHRAIAAARKGIWVFGKKDRAATVLLDRRYAKTVKLPKGKG